MYTRQLESALIDSILEDAFATYGGNVNSGHHLLPIIELYHGHGLPLYLNHMATQTPSSSECSDDYFGIPVQEDDAANLPSYMDGWDPRISYEEDWIEDNSAWPLENGAADAWNEGDSVWRSVLYPTLFVEDDYDREEIVQSTHPVEGEWWKWLYLYEIN